jgi:transposase
MVQKWKDNEISEFSGVDRKTVKKWVERYENTGNVEDMEGREKLLAREDEQLLTLFENHENITLVRAQSIMKRRKLDIYQKQPSKNEFFYFSFLF